LTDELISYPTDPVSLFKEWLAEADKSENVNPTAMALATADASGVPSVRMVLLKHVDERGFSFYTNSESRKGIEISQNPRASLCFYWKSLLREVRVDGPVSNVGQEEADDYFSTRTRGSQIGAWASKQSRPLEGRFELEKRIAAYSVKFNVGKYPDQKTGKAIVFILSASSFGKNVSFDCMIESCIVIPAKGGKAKSFILESNVEVISE